MAEAPPATAADDRDEGDQKRFARFLIERRGKEPRYAAAKRANISNGGLFKIERGYALPEAATLRKLCAAYGVADFDAAHELLLAARSERERQREGRG